MSVEVVERFLEARAAGDIEACVALAADRATWHSPVGEPQHGRPGFRAALEDAYAETSWFATETLGVRPHEDVFAAQVRNRGERDGQELDSLQLLVFRVEDGLIVDVRIHVDDERAVAEFWAD
ncbi:MAG: SnoaL-like domain [Gaiellales bacterium]|nr:SnoaL-like domain [Gaiellales bacterium]MDX6621423.1 SnoaL-like domain [Gaiellales bacterium]